MGHVMVERNRGDVELQSEVTGGVIGQERELGAGAGVSSKIEPLQNDGAGLVPAALDLVIVMPGWVGPAASQDCAVTKPLILVGGGPWKA